MPASSLPLAGLCRSTTSNGRPRFFAVSFSLICRSTWRSSTPGASVSARDLGEIAAHMFEKLSHNADERGQADAAILAADRLVALDSTREDWQRMALRLTARYRGREAALNRAKAFLDLLKRELDTDPERETLSLIEAIRSETIGPSASATSTELAFSYPVRPQPRSFHLDPRRRRRPRPLSARKPACARAGIRADGLLRPRLPALGFSRSGH